MAVKQSDFAKGICDLATPECAGQTITHFLKYTIPAAGLPLNDIIELGVVPAGTKVVDMTLHSDDLDTGSTLALDVGLMNGTWQDPDQSRTVGAEFFSADAVAQAGGSSRMSLASGFNVAKSDSDRSIGVKIQAAATGAQTGEIRLNVLLASE